MQYSNRRPDEEGIKTNHSSKASRKQSIPTADLMKKGLRRPPGARPEGPRTIPTADLMKKGLRRGAISTVRRGCYSNRRPDEEGIKTERGGGVAVEVHSNRRPDEEGIKTRR